MAGLLFREGRGGGQALMERRSSFLQIWVTVDQTVSSGLEGLRLQQTSHRTSGMWVGGLHSPP